MDEVMQIAFEVRESLPDNDYKRLVEKIAEINPNKDITIEYPHDPNGINKVVVGSPISHINRLKQKYKDLVERYNKDTTRYLRIITDLTEENIKLRKDADDWDDDDEDDDGGA